MQQEQRIRLYCAAAIAALAAVAGGCTDAGGSLIIVQNQIPATGCVVSTDQSTNFRGRGRIDTQASDGYLFTPLVESLVKTESSDVNPKVIAVEGADVDVSFPSGLFSSSEKNELRDAALTRFSEAFSGSVFPGAKTSFGFTVLPRGLLERMADKLGDGESTVATVKVVIFGQLNDGGVESDPFRYPIEVCDGCMQIDNGPCANLPDGFEASPGGECNPLQDVPVDCCSEGATQVCPAVAPSA